MPLFVPADADGTLPSPRGSDASEPPPEPEGERYAQLQALFPGRVIEVTRQVEATPDAQGEGGASSASQETGYPATNDYAAEPTQSDEPRYDTAAEAAAEEYE